MRGGAASPPDLDALAALLEERIGDLALTPAERAEALCIALGVGSALSAAARGVSPATIRASRRRLRRKIERALAAPPARGPCGGA